MSFRAFVSKFKPPLTEAQVDAIVAEHERLASKTEAKQSPVEED